MSLIQSTVYFLSAVIIFSPDSVTVFLHHDAVFSCLSHDGTTQWRVNDTNLPSDLYSDLVTHQTMSADIYLLTLTIPGRAKYNGTRVKCVTEDGSDSVGSLISTLKIQGVYVYNTCMVCVQHSVRP